MIYFSSCNYIFVTHVTVSMPVGEIKCIYLLIDMRFAVSYCKLIKNYHPLIISKKEIRISSEIFSCKYFALIHNPTVPLNESLLMCINIRHTILHTGMSVPSMCVPMPDCGVLRCGCWYSTWLTWYLLPSCSNGGNASRILILTCRYARTVSTN